MATTFTQAKATLDEIAGRATTNRKRLEQAKALVDQAVTDLTAMTTGYGTFVSDLNALATANPGVAAIQAAKAEKDQLVADFQALKTAAEALQTAINS